MKGAFEIGQCVCPAGTYNRTYSYSNDWDCKKCEPGFYCPGSANDNNGAMVECPPDSIALNSEFVATGVNDCKCKPSFYGSVLDPGGCQACPEGAFCPGGFTMSTCPENAVAPAFSENASSCVCSFGYYGEDGGVCTPCGEGHYCPGGTARFQCPEHSYVFNIRTAMSLSDCTCYNGEILDLDLGICVPCPMGWYCPGENNPKQPCPPGSGIYRGISHIDDCYCRAGYRAVVVPVDEFSCGFGEGSGSGSGSGSGDGSGSGFVTGSGSGYACGSGSGYSHVTAHVVSGSGSGSGFHVDGGVGFGVGFGVGVGAGTGAGSVDSVNVSDVVVLACYTCPPPFYCEYSALVECPPHSHTQINRASSVESCVCDDGYQNSNSVPGPGGEKCVPCFAGYWCKGGEHFACSTNILCPPFAFKTPCTAFMDHQCIDCSEMPLNAHKVVSNSLEGGGCEWDCDDGYFRSSSETGNNTVAICKPCSNTTLCDAGYHLGKCDKSPHVMDSQCVRCSDIPVHGTPVASSPTCEFTCDEGFFKPLYNGLRTCCSENAYLHVDDSGSKCQCLPGWSGDGVSCVL
eukprot:3936040-Rhodomonas_salina.1